MNKNNIFTLSLGIVNLAITLCLTIFCVPNSVPLIANFDEEIIVLCSKWLLVLNISLPLIFATLSIIFSKRKNISFLLKLLLGIMLYENMLVFAYFSVENSFSVGDTSQIPYALSILMPIAIFGVIWSQKMKRLPYKCRFGMRNKYSLETEFLWKQIHLLASDTYFKSFLVAFVLMIPFVFIKFAYIGLVVILIIFAVSTAYILKESKKLHNKYLELKDHHEKHKKRMEEYDKMQEKNKG